MNLDGWTYRFTFGYSLDVYSKGNEWVGIPRGEEEPIIRYKGDKEIGPKYRKRVLLTMQRQTNSVS